jgi:hypothetical protein
MGEVPSKYDRDPLDPGASGGNSGSSAPPTFTGTVPDVQVAWGSAPPVVADESPGTGKSAGAAQHQPLKVDIGGIKTAENAALSGAAIAVNAYENLKSMVTATQDFGQNAVIHSPDRGPTGVASPVRDQARQFAAQLIPTEENALTQVADSLELIGQYIAALNTAAQTYATADYKSQFPDPGN